ncbi:MAG: ATP-binding protein [Planctomycetes bacterium]|nr:ATP-binding protein [Planctomycetota bacterium]
MNDEVEQLLKNLHLSRIVQVLDDELAAARGKDPGHEEFLLRLLRAQWHDRQEKALEWRIKQARLPFPWTIESFPFQRQTGVSRRQIRNFATLEFVPRAENIVFVGKTGVGKTGLAVGLLLKALQNGYRALFIKAQELFDEMYASLADRSTPRYIRRLSRTDALAVDDLGLRPLVGDEPLDLYEVIRQRYERGSMIVTSNRAIAEWPPLFLDALVATAAMDRLLHDAQVIVMEGDSHRNPPTTKRRKGWKMVVRTSATRAERRGESRVLVTAVERPWTADAAWKTPCLFERRSFPHRYLPTASPRLVPRRAHAGPSAAALSAPDPWPVSQEPCRQPPWTSLADPTSDSARRPHRLRAQRRARHPNVLDKWTCLAEPRVDFAGRSLTETALFIRVDHRQDSPGEDRDGRLASVSREQDARVGDETSVAPEDNAGDQRRGHRDVSKSDRAACRGVGDAHGAVRGASGGRQRAQRQRCANGPLPVLRDLEGETPAVIGLDPRAPHAGVRVRLQVRLEDLVRDGRAVFMDEPARHADESAVHAQIDAGNVTGRCRPVPGRADGLLVPAECCARLQCDCDADGPEVDFAAHGLPREHRQGRAECIVCR